MLYTGVGGKVKMNLRNALYQAGHCVINSLPNNKILEWSKFKVFADNKINVG